MQIFLGATPRSVSRQQVARGHSSCDVIALFLDRACAHLDLD